MLKTRNRTLHYLYPTREISFMLQLSSQKLNKFVATSKVGFEKYLLGQAAIYKLHQRVFCSRSKQLIFFPIRLNHHDQTVIVCTAYA